MLSNLKFRLSSELVSKLCLVQHVFRKNGLPNDVFWYMLEPLFKTDMKKDVCVWSDNGFVSMFEYGYNFDVVLKDEYDVFGDYFVKFIKNKMFLPDIYGKYNRSSICDTHKKIITLHTCNITHNKLPIHTLFSFSKYNVNGYICYVKTENETCNMNLKEICKILKIEANNIMRDYKNKYDCDHYDVNIIKNHLITLQTFV